MSRCSGALERVGLAHEIAASRAPTPAERAALEARAAALDAALAPCGAEEARRRVAALFAMIPSGKAEADDTREVLKLYAGMLAGFALWAVAAACRGVVEAGERFRPAAGDLVVRARAAAAPAQAERAAIQALLAAKVAPEIDEAQRARVRARFAELRGEAAA